MITFFDTETTGLPSRDKSAPLELQPHVMQLAVSMYDDTRRPVFELSTLVFLPDNAIIGDIAFQTHGISREMCKQYGMQKHQAIALLRFAVARSELVVAHNLKFDRALLSFECLRTDTGTGIGDANSFCTMEAASPVMKLPPTHAMVKAHLGNKFKSPKLSECYERFFGEPLVGAHDALIDTRACARVYYWLLDNGHIKH